jgi:hypothetical protein
MTDAHKTAWIDYMCFLYGASPSVTLTVVGSSGTLTGMSDTRMQAGSQSTSTTSLPGEGTTAEPSVVTVSYDRITKTNASVSPTADTGTTHMVYYDGSGSIQAMTLQDMKDTFFYPAINKLVSGSESNTTAGTYTISTGTSLANNTLISSTPVFSDTRANTGAYSSGGIPETLDQPTTITNYYLHRRNAVDPVWSNLQAPLYIEGSNNLQQYAEGTFDTLYQNWMREIASEDTSGTYRITYTVGTSGGTTKGTGMVDTRLNGSGAHTTRFVGLDDYRAQEFPNGSAATITTYNLRIAKQ